MDEQKESHISTIMKELSDIKSSLAVNTNETANIKGSIAEIKQDIKDIKNDAVNRREFADEQKIRTKMQDKIEFLQKIAYGGLAILGALQFYFSVFK